MNGSGQQLYGTSVQNDFGGFVVFETNRGLHERGSGALK